MNLLKISIILLLFISCSSKKKENEAQTEKLKNEQLSIKNTIITKKDSVDIQSLIRKVYKWNKSNIRNYFDIGIEDNDYSVVSWSSEGEKAIKYIGIGWNEFDSNKNDLEKTDYFSKGFITNYREILKNIDYKVKNGDYEWYKGYLPPFGTGANEWCHCQDHPDEYWKTMIIKTIDLKNDSVNLTWDWGKDTEWDWIDEYKTGYPLTVIKESGSWKISYMDGFDKKHY
ncbi:hypothetical protein Celal_3194 [Cellulophaga algicola DSM 14237]|uniref:Lipoprotein n=1 Tax=Cellulophaga algicola (strain DSM 14237 / IC166 / ACAM 630) TaxID=688270 RepID=E6X4X4_CELAD|nr:hypothetical protein [Cellulophaga algicola]ADV50466.1 hypothetical protein Celal_3194 [Cellulophaga algicola DSM 14237]